VPSDDSPWAVPSGPTIILYVVSVADAGTVVAAVVAIVGFVGPVRAYYNRTVGRRFDLYRRFDRLGVGSHQSFFETVIGEAPTIRRTLTRELPDYSAVADDESEPPLVEHTFTESLGSIRSSMPRPSPTRTARSLGSRSPHARGSSLLGLPRRVQSRRVPGCSHA
jgi:hypothetical protein